jgi:hypothetical protein
MSREVFTRELRMIREQTRGRVRVQASFGCQNPRCAVTTVTIVFEETDESLPAQAPVYCNRCRQELTQYIGIQRRQ